MAWKSFWIIKLNIRLKPIKSLKSINDDMKLKESNPSNEIANINGIKEESS